MGTVVEHPLFALVELQNHTEGNPRTNSVEIIDVDAHDDQFASSSTVSSRAFRSDAAVISLVDDSDDEIQILSDPLPGRPQETSNRRRLRSPSINIMSTPPPPVPPIPRRFAGFTSFPASRTGPVPFSAPPVRPNTQPFAFERNLIQPGPSTIRRQSPLLPPPRSAPLPQAGDAPAAPPSHHVPSMGLGGALISSNNARAQAVAQAARAAARMSHAIRRRPMSWFVSAANHFDELLIHDPIENPNPPHIRRWLESQRDSFLMLYNRVQGNEPSQPKYFQKYTHPDQPEAGFTFDFAPNSSDEDTSRRFPPTSAKAPIIVNDDKVSEPSRAPSTTPTVQGNLTTVLICARCMTPLLLNESLGPDDSGRRVWALRCGHMIDEQCLNEIGQPDEEADPGNQQPQQQETSVDNKKGKGKSRVKQKPSYGETPEESSVSPTSGSNNIRSRLRSAAAAASSSSSSSTPHMSLPLRPSTKRRRTTTTAAPKIEAKFEWKCPVASCQLEHASVKIDGKWGPDKVELDLAVNNTVKARGAIPVFA